MVTWWKQSFSLGLTRTRTAQMFPENQNVEVDCGKVVLCGAVVVIIMTTTVQQLRDERCENCLPMIPMRPITETRMPSQVYLYHSTTLQYKTIIMCYRFIISVALGILKNWIKVISRMLLNLYQNLKLINCLGCERFR